MVLIGAERSEHIAEWVRLTESGISSQVATKAERGRPEGGINAASRELGITKDEAHRAVKIASLSPEAKAAAKGIMAGMVDAIAMPSAPRRRV